MLSYVYRNRKLKPKDVRKQCEKEFEFDIAREKNDEIFLSNKLLTIMIDKKYTRILLENEQVNIQNLELLF